MADMTFAGCVARVGNIAGDVDRQRNDYEAIGTTIVNVKKRVDNIAPTYAAVTDYLGSNAGDAAVDALKAQVDKVLADLAQLQADVNATAFVLGCIQQFGQGAVVAKLQELGA